jgi:hypothetical protein
MIGVGAIDLAGLGLGPALLRERRLRGFAEHAFPMVRIPRLMRHAVGLYNVNLS